VGVDEPADTGVEPLQVCNAASLGHYDFIVWTWQVSGRDGLGQLFETTDLVGR
jgi:hypothetical protein